MDHIGPYRTIPDHTHRVRFHIKTGDRQTHTHRQTDRQNLWNLEVLTHLKILCLKFLHSEGEIPHKNGGQTHRQTHTQNLWNLEVLTHLKKNTKKCSNVKKLRKAEPQPIFIGSYIKKKSVCK